MWYIDDLGIGEGKVIMEEGPNTRVLGWWELEPRHPVVTVHPLNPGQNHDISHWETRRRQYSSSRREIIL